MVICHTTVRNPHLKLLRVVHAGDGLHEVGGGVVPEVRADISYPQTPGAGLQVLGVLKGRLVERIDLWRDGDRCVRLTRMHPKWLPIPYIVNYLTKNTALRNEKGAI